MTSVDNLRMVNAMDSVLITAMPAMIPQLRLTMTSDRAPWKDEVRSSSANQCTAQDDCVLLIVDSLWHSAGLLCSGLPCTFKYVHFRIPQGVVAWLHREHLVL